MTFSQAGRTAGLETEWKDLTDRHEYCRTVVEDNIEAFPDARVPATYVIGPIGSGKSELLYHAFRYAWKEVEKPALYIHLSGLNTILMERARADGLEKVPQDELHQYIENICTNSLRDISEDIGNRTELTRDHLLPETRQQPAVKPYFDDLGLSVSEAETIANKSDEIILLIDEMEDGYKDLSDAVGGTTGPLRDVVDVIERGESRFYLTASFGYASAHELGEAEARRVRKVNLPVIRPRQVSNIMGESISPSDENFAWWRSRGRPGWLAESLDTKSELLDDIDGRYDQLNDIGAQEISRVEILSVDSIESELTTFRSESRDLIAYLLCSPGPVQLSEFDDELKIRDIIDVEAKERLLCSNSLTDVNEVYNTFLAGLENLEYFSKSVETHHLRQFGERVLQGIANRDNQIVFGHILSPDMAQGAKAHSMIMRPLAERMHDIALEELDEDSQETIDFLYQLTKDLEARDAQDLFSDFGDFFDLFGERGELSGESHVSISLNMLILAFPSFITNPRLGFGGGFNSESEQYEDLLSTLRDFDASKKRLEEFGQILQGDFDGY
jgi:hypothetical protein